MTPGFLPGNFPFFFLNIRQHSWNWVIEFLTHSYDTMIKKKNDAMPFGVDASDQDSIDGITQKEIETGS